MIQFKVDNYIALEVGKAIFFVSKTIHIIILINKAQKFSSSCQTHRCRLHWDPFFHVLCERFNGLCDAQYSIIASAYCDGTHTSYY